VKGFLESYEENGGDLYEEVERMIMTAVLPEMKKGAVISNDSGNTYRVNRVGKGVKFDENGQNIWIDSTMSQIQKGEYKVVWPNEWATTAMAWPMRP